MQCVSALNARSKSEIGKEVESLAHIGGGMLGSFVSLQITKISLIPKIIEIYMSERIFIIILILVCPRSTPGRLFEHGIRLYEREREHSVLEREESETNHPEKNHNHQTRGTV